MAGRSPIVWPDTPYGRHYPAGYRNDSRTLFWKHAGRYDRSRFLDSTSFTVYTAKGRNTSPTALLLVCSHVKTSSPGSFKIVNSNEDRGNLCVRGRSTPSLLEYHQNHSRYCSQKCHSPFQHALDKQPQYCWPATATVVYRPHLTKINPG